MGARKLDDQDFCDKGRFIIGCYDRWISDPVQFCRELLLNNPQNPSFEMFLHQITILTEVESIRKVINDDLNCFEKGPMAKGLLPLIGNGLLLSQGEFWRRQRQLSQPAFHRKKISSFISPIIHLTDEALEKWEKNPEINIFEEVSQLTFKGMSRTILGSDIDDYASGATKNLAEILNIFSDRCGNIRKLPLWIPSAKNQKVNHSLKKLDTIVYKIIDDRRKLEVKPNDLLTELITANDESGMMSNKQLRDELMTLLLAGFDTTSNLMTWTIYLLASNPKWEDLVYDEVRDFTLDDSTKISHLSKLPVLFSVVKESLRLYPPAWVFVRTPIEKYTLDGRTFTRNSSIFISPFFLHRDQRFWTDPEKFDPSRMEKINHIVDLDKGYMPFSNGERICIGANFAITEAMTMLCKIFQRYKFSGNDTSNVKPRAAITLKPNRDLLWTARKR